MQGWNLPFHWIAKETGFKFNNLFCEVLDVMILESGSKLGRHLKILVEINLDRPLLRGIMIKCDTQEVWIDFKNENVAVFVFIVVWLATLNEIVSLG